MDLFILILGEVKMFPLTIYDIIEIFPVVFAKLITLWKHMIKDIKDFKLK